MLEIVVVVAILAVLAAVAIPRLSRGSGGAAEQALEQDLSVLRRAIELYAVEHRGNYPGAAAIAGQLTAYTDEQGSVRVAPDSTHIYGPYVRIVPPLPVGLRKGNTKIAQADAIDVGWIYLPATGHIRANTGPTEKDSKFVLFRNY